MFYDTAHFNQSFKNWNTSAILHSLKKSRTLDRDGNDGSDKDNSNPK